MSKNIEEVLIEQLGSAKVLLGNDIKERYHHIWKMNEPLKAKAVVLPRSTEDVSLIMKACYDHKQQVVIHGGLTNLVGATETCGNEVVISLEKMNAIEEIDEASRSMTIQSGVILENIQNTAKDKNLLFPLNFGAKGSAQIGGVIATNAGGLRVLKYGMTRHLVLGLEVVLADGTIISSLKKIIKDNSAYDLKQLFIGSEGTLGVITKAILKLSEAPKSRNSAFIGIDDYDKVVQFMKYMDRGLAGTLSGYELIWNVTYRALTGDQASVKPPLPYDYKYYVLIESLGSQQESDKARMEELLQMALEEEMILDAVMAQTESDLSWFWTIREDVHVMVSQCNNDQHFDISLPIPLIGETIDRIMENLESIEEYETCYPFGHVADGNIHLVISKSIQNENVIHAINQVIYSPLQAIGGSISAEHGIGNHKKRYLHLSRTNEEIQLMKLLKSSIDPYNLLNPGKVLC